MAFNARFPRPYYILRGTFDLVKNDLKSGTKISLPKRLKMWLLGFDSEKYYLYDLNKNNYKDYLSERDYFLTVHINKKHKLLFDDKIVFEKFFSGNIRIPKNYAIIRQGKVLPLCSEPYVTDISSIINVCNKENGIVVKPVGGSAGEGVSIIKIKEESILINNQSVSQDDFAAYLLGIDNCIVTEFIKQGKYAERIFPNTTNTIRVLALRDTETKEPYIAGAAHRIGGERSGGVDNFAQGGFSASLNLDTGELGAAANITNNTLKFYDFHPETGAQIKGVVASGWVEAKKDLLKVMVDIPYINYVGWDIVLTDEGMVVIEGNSFPVLRTIQAHKPLYQDPRVRAFYEHYGVIKK